VIDISKIARQEGIKSVMVTAGYIDKEARKDVYKYIDAANVDLKAFTERFYHKVTFSHLKDILETLVWLKNETDVWFEITTLLIPDENDSAEEIKNECDWILSNLGDSVPLHFTAFHPDFKMLDKNRTPELALTSARNIALSMGIKYCYVGNIHNREGQTTYCHNCGTTLIERDWHSVLKNKLKSGKCYKCNSSIPGCY
jgi:pyruvate formate lyase activating enzyme